MTRFALAATCCALALSACSQPADTATTETETETMTSNTSLTDAIAAGDADALRARLELAHRVVPNLDLLIARQLVVDEARACSVDDSVTIPLVDLPEDATDPAANGAQADTYLTAMLDEPCVFALPSGLLFRIRTAVEEGASPMRGDVVTVNYRGQLLNGEEFDSSWTRGEPATFPSDRLIAGWVEALPLMQVGERWELFIHPDLAYGMRGTPGGPIGPNMALVFELELLDLPG
ncbi:MULTISPECIES: FKBP-type peptidyl-prolyl cis-trans isomerase [Maricaulis]|jgi:FKBP-type peptidyl-prolyl cis-trans isomerase FklB|uniref:Peptidyl-prolyl cis-trans isomerase n=1 Tax=Maricaulis maris (strain MCS10) TaxID=394221 RepID=Q0ALF3_MARMM|nr:MULTISPECIES: FKBP-type peptidyl-prolyl cis-trans isomerase [Maricaulis]ABI66890.1 Peptidylprolyl isomerase [Maricaulis maris MCS10]